MALLSSCPLAQAADKVWNNTGTDFNNGANWTGGAPGTGDRAVFDAAAVTQPALTGPLTIQGLNFTASGYTLTSGGQALTLTAPGSGAGTSSSSIFVAASAVNSVNAPIILGGAAGEAHSFRGMDNSQTTINGAISSANAIAGLNFTGGVGTFVLNSANTYSGSTTIGFNGTVTIGNAQALSSGTLVWNNSNGGLSAGINLTGANKLNNNIVFQSAEFFLRDSGANAIQFGGSLDLGAGTGVPKLLKSQISGGAIFDGVIGNDNGRGLEIQLANGSNVTLNGVNTYTGHTTIRGTGAVRVSNIGAAGVAGNLGQGTTINLGFSGVQGSLIYTGVGESTSKVINLNGGVGGGLIEQAGSGTLKFTANTTATGAGSKSLTLAGSTSGVGEISGAVVNNSGANITSVVKNGSGLWILSGNNTYTGVTTINSGALQADDGTGLNASSVLQLRGGVLQTKGVFTRTLGTAAGNVNWQSGAGGFAARGGNLILNLNSGTSSLTWGTTSTSLGGSELIFGSSTADSLVDLQNGIGLGSALRAIRVDDNTSSTTDIARISGVISGASGGGISKEGDGVLELTGANTYTAATNVNAGTLILSSNKAAGNTSELNVNGGSLDVRGTVTLGAGGDFNLTSGTLLLQLGTNFDQIISSGSGSFSITGGIFQLDVSGSGFNYGNTYQVLDGFGGVNSVSNLSFTGYNTGSYLASLDTDGVLSFTVVPEPGAALLLVGGMTFLVLVRRRPSSH